MEKFLCHCTNVENGDTKTVELLPNDIIYDKIMLTMDLENYDLYFDGNPLDTNLKTEESELTNGCEIIAKYGKSTFLVNKLLKLSKEEIKLNLKSGSIKKEIFNAYTNHCCNIGDAKPNMEICMCLVELMIIFDCHNDISYID